MHTRLTKRIELSRSGGFALVITLIMVVLAAIIVIAVLTNASSDRATASSLSKRLRAEMAAQSGLAAALTALVGGSAPVDFRFVTAVGDDGKPVLIPLKYDAITGITSLDVTNKRLLYSSGSTNATLTLSTTANPKPTRAPGYVAITTKVNGADQEMERFAFYVDESGSRQNLSIHGGSNRIYTRDPAELPVVTATAPPTPFSATQTQTIKDSRSLLFTPSTANPVLSTNPVTPPVDDYSYTTASAVTNLTPEGKSRVNLLKLKSYIDGLAVDQAKNNVRAKLVERLLDPAEQGTDWGADDGKGGKMPGGNLSFLTKLTHYSSTQCRQIVANLLDYIDSDLIPTTDDVDNPTYFGVEGKDNGSGIVVGHPYINFVGTGLVFNRSTAAGKQGSLNSTRVLAFIGLVNPWSADTKAWETFYVQPELEIQIGGTASGGNLGFEAAAYFLSAFSTANYDNLGDDHLLDHATSTISPNTGVLFPHTVGTGSAGQYANFDNLLGNGKQQPANMSFSSVTFTVKKLRLKYTGTDGLSGYVQILDGLKTIAQPMSQSPINMGASGGALVYRLGTGQTGNTTKTDFHLNGDPRISFISQPSPTPSAIWILSKSSPNPAPYAVEPALAAPPAPSPTTGSNVFTAADINNNDFPTPTPSAKDYSWYTKTDVASNFYVKSPPSDGSAPKLDSIGELGYLHTGIPWETLRFYVTGNETGGKERDRELLAYVHSGTFPSADYTTVSTGAGQAAPANPISLMAGVVNVNTNKRPTLQSLFLGASATLDTDTIARAKGATDSDASPLANAVGANAATAPFALPADYLSLAAVKAITNAQTTDFGREVLARRTANVLGTQSTRFTVYSLGEARDKVGTSTVTTSSVNLRAEVELQTDSAGKPMPKVLSTAYYLNN